MINKVIAFDLETTGFSSIKDEILEIGAVAYFPKTDEQQFFNYLVDVKNIPDKITELTGISRKTLEDEGCYPLKLVLEAFEQFIKQDGTSYLLVGHNIQNFDLRFLKEKNGLFWANLSPLFQVWDTMIVHRNKNSSRRPAKADLLSTCSYYGIKYPPFAHRALIDASLALSIFLKQYAKNRNKILLASKKV